MVSLLYNPPKTSWSDLYRLFLGLPIFFVSIGFTGICLAAPIRLHPDNPHYFEYKGRPTILITSAEHYGAVLNLDFDFETYLDELRDKGMNYTRTFSGAYCEKPGEFKIEKNTLAPAFNRFISPWARSNIHGYIFGGNKFDLSKWDEDYFKRLKSFLSEAEKRGIIVELVLFCPFYNPTLWTFSPMNARNNINGIGNVQSTDVYAHREIDLTQVQERMVKKIVTELNRFDNLFYEICNEPYFGGVTGEWQRRISQTIVDTEKNLANKHLIAQNIANGSQVIEDPDPNVSIFNFHYAYPPHAIHQNYHLNKVIGYDETGFSGSSDTTYRRHGWAFCLAGGGLYNNLDYSFTTHYENGTAKTDAPGGGSAALRSQLKVLQDFMQSLDFINMKPDPSVIQSVEGDETIQAWCLAKPERQYALYLTGGSKANLRLDIPSGVYRVEWIHTITGEVMEEKGVSHTAISMRLVSPTYEDDIALRIRRVGS